MTLLAAVVGVAVWAAMRRRHAGAQQAAEALYKESQTSSRKNEGGPASSARGTPTPQTSQSAAGIRASLFKSKDKGEQLDQSPSTVSIADQLLSGTTTRDDSGDADGDGDGGQDTELSKQGLAQLVAAAEGSMLRLSSKGSSRSRISHQSSQASKTLPADAVKALAAAMDAGEANKLTIMGVLGKGSFGTVYQAKWRGLAVAVKTLVFSAAGGGAGGVSSYDAAVNEAALCTRMNHRNIVATYHFDVKRMAVAGEARSPEGEGSVQGANSGSRGAGTTKSLEEKVREAGAATGAGSGSGYTEHQEFKLYLVQELCSTTLIKACKANVMHTLDAERLPFLDSVFTTLLDVAQGIGYLHSAGVVHGDIKPANVLLKADAGCPAGFVAKLSDFGLSAHLDADATHVSHFSRGTPFYVAPETVHRGRLTRASDMYSLGVVMWETYNATPPWVRGRDGQYAPNPAFPHTWRCDAPPAFRDLVARCLQQEPEQRPAASEVAAVLRALLVLSGTPPPDSGQGVICEAGVTAGRS
uniref:Protein kinase domain-containing protein n=1 Tax=Chlamydomonas leiostraca TaxID=1034604 RepID=A0A7S0RA10_9CHLO